MSRSAIECCMNVSNRLRQFAWNFKVYDDLHANDHPTHSQSVNDVYSKPYYVIFIINFYERRQSQQTENHRYQFVIRLFVSCDAAALNRVTWKTTELVSERWMFLFFLAMWLWQFWRRQWTDQIRKCGDRRRSLPRSWIGETVNACDDIICAHVTTN